MSITVIGIFLILLFLMIGYFRGMLRILAAIASLVVGGLLAGPLSPLFRGFIEGSEYVPRALVPLAALFAAGGTVFLLGLVVSEFVLAGRRRRRLEKDLPALPGWERWGGAIIGGVWGFCLALLIFMGIDIIGRVEEAMMPVPSLKGNQAKFHRKDESQFAALRNDLNHSLFMPLVNNLSPVDEKVSRVFRNMATVVGDPVLFEKFQKHPEVAKLANDPRLIEAASDPEIQQHIQNQDFYRLLDNPKIAALAEDDQIFDALKDVDMDAILSEIIKESEAEATYITPSI